MFYYIPCESKKNFVICDIIVASFEEKKARHKGFEPQTSESGRRSDRYAILDTNIKAVNRAFQAKIITFLNINISR